jgi:RNA polymerase sigma factor (sigma-70 family)
VREPLGGTVVRTLRTDSAEGRTEDAALVERAQHGDADAYGELVRRYQGVATRTAYVITGAAAEAEDAAQDGFTKAYFALDRFRAGAPFRPWLLRIVANEAKNRRKAAGRRPTVDLSVAEDRPSGDTALSPEAAALASERRESVLAALRKLREEDRLVIAYRYFLELSEAEMADALGVARGTVKSRLSRALGRLRELAAGEVPIDG